MKTNTQWHKLKYDLNKSNPEQEKMIAEKSEKEFLIRWQDYIKTIHHP